MIKQSFLGFVSPGYSWDLSRVAQRGAVGSQQLWALSDTRGDRVPDPAAAQGVPGLGLK